MSVPRNPEEVESHAVDELERIEKWEGLLADRAPVSEAELTEGLSDPSEAVRAEILDYLADVPRSQRMVAALLAHAQTESAVQCVARLAYLSSVWDAPEIQEVISYRPTICESEYILTWIYAGRVIVSQDMSSLVKLCVQSEYDDWELSNLAQNLLDSLGYNEDLRRVATRKVSEVTDILRLR